MTLTKDLAMVALILLLMPVIMAVALVAVVVMLLLSLYRWARGNTTSTSRIGSHEAQLAPRVLVPAYATSRRRRL